MITKIEERTTRPGGFLRPVPRSVARSSCSEWAPAGGGGLGGSLPAALLAFFVFMGSACVFRGGRLKWS